MAAQEFHSSGVVSVCLLSGFRAPNFLGTTWRLFCYGNRGCCFRFSFFLVFFSYFSLNICVCVCVRYLWQQLFEFPPPPFLAMKSFCSRVFCRLLNFPFGAFAGFPEFGFVLMDFSGNKTLEAQIALMNKYLMLFCILNELWIRKSDFALTVFIWAPWSWHK